MADLDRLRQQLGFVPSDGSDRLIEALTHRSFAVENHISCDNQRLEFLGDAVLEIILTDYLFALYPDAQEGELTKMRSALARESTLAHLATALELGNFLRIGRGEAEAGGDRRASTLADLFEAVLGALYLNAGFDHVKRFCTALFASHYPDPRALLDVINPKGALQEFSQARWGETPVYKVLRVEGPEHQPNYEVEVALHHYVARGSGHSRKLAECDAAKNLGNYFHSPEFGSDDAI